MTCYSGSKEVFEQQLLWQKGETLIVINII